jgi:hypothetical protein
MRQKVISDLVKSIKIFIPKARCVVDSPDDEFFESGAWFVDVFIDNRIFVIEYFGDDKPFGLSEVGGGADSSYTNTSPDHLCSASEAVVNKLIEFLTSKEQIVGDRVYNKV